jgi:DNA polymerase I-like protein with 3'-5' exonuclease and polymerase domains
MASKTVHGRGQLPLFVPQSDWTPPAMGDLPSSWADFKRVAIDCETRDEHLRKMGPGVRRGAYIAGVSFAVEDGPSFYLPVRHAEGPNLDPAQVFAYLRHQAKLFKGTLVGANLGYDLDFMAEQDVEWTPKWFRDIQVAEPLLDELKDSYSFESIARDHGLPGKDERLLREAAAAYGLDPKKDLWQLPSRFVGQYGTMDTVRLHPILRRQEKMIDEQELQNIYDLESQVLPVLVRMRRRGVRVNEAKLEEVAQFSRRGELELIGKIKHATGMTIEPNTAHMSDVVAPVLRAAGCQPPSTGKGKDSVTKDWLATQKGEVPKLIVELRQMLKLRTTFVASIREHMTNGRIHATFNQLRTSDPDEDDDDEQEGGRFGRLSCVKPNMQQQLARNKVLGPLWRSIFIPEHGALWAACDYSQQEPRVAIHASVLAGEADLINRFAYRKALDAAQKYIDNPATDNHQMMADMAGIERKDAKEIFLGLSYGMGGAKLCRKLGLPTAWVVYDPKTYARHYADSPEGKALLEAGERMHEGAGPQGQDLLDRFDRQVPFIKKTAKAMQKLAEKRGFIVTLEGRRCRFPKRPDGGYDWAHKAFNRYVQGSSADQTKKAIVALDREGYFLQLQVHDECDGSVADYAEARRMADIMETVLPLRLPSKVDIEIGPSWGEAKGVA